MKHALVITLTVFAVFQCINCHDALDFLDKISGTTADNCDPGTGKTLDIPLNYSMFEEMTRTAILTSNFITQYIGQNGGVFNCIADETYYLMIKNNLAGQDHLFGSGIALEPNQHPQYRLFSPYAFFSDGSITALDYSVTVDYTSPDSEWYFVPKNKDYESVLEVKTVTSMQGSPEEIEGKLLVATLEDGHWTKPYFDCGGSNIWLTSYSSPILYKQPNGYSGKVEFKGVATADKDLTSIDINQCDEEDGGMSDPFFGIFRGTHKCQKTTQCEPKSGAGMKRGSYYCKCMRGYYFPHTYSVLKAFDGEDIEAAHKSDGDLSQFKCLPCSPGCKACVDDTTCIWPIGYRQYKNYNPYYHGYRQHQNHNSYYHKASSSSSSSDSSSDHYKNVNKQIYKYKIMDHPYQYHDKADSVHAYKDNNKPIHKDKAYPYQYHDKTKSVYAYKDNNKPIHKDKDYPHQYHDKTNPEYAYEDVVE